MGEQKLFEHVGANAVGILDDRFDQNTPIVHFRGIKYASIARRFAAPVSLSRNKQTKLQATEYGSVFPVTYGCTAALHIARPKHEENDCLTVICQTTLPTCSR